MLQALQITSRICCKKMTEGLGQNFNKLFFIEPSKNFL